MIKCGAQIRRILQTQVSLTMCVCIAVKLYGPIRIRQLNPVSCDRQLSVLQLLAVSTVLQLHKAQSSASEKGKPVYRSSVNHPTKSHTLGRGGLVHGAHVPLGVALNQSLTTLLAHTPISTVFLLPCRLTCLIYFDLRMRENEDRGANLEISRVWSVSEFSSKLAGRHVMATESQSSRLPGPEQDTEPDVDWLSWHPTHCLGMMAGPWWILQVHK